MQVIGRRLSRPSTNESGIIAIAVALSMLALVVVGAMVLDFGLLRVNRQQLQLAADDAAISGLHAADGGTTSLFTYRGVCGALDFLKANNAVFKGLSDDNNTCPSPNPNLGLTCDESNPFALPRAADFEGTVTSGGATYQVSIKSPYLIDTSFQEEGLPTRASDTTMSGGCDQLAVTISMTRQPGLGSMATSSDLKAWIRSVGRIKIGTGDDSPALLLLERSACGVLVVGSGGSPSRIQVEGSASPASVATIHSDSTATGPGCGSNPNQQLFQGNQSGGIVAYGDGTRDGKITSVASDNGVASNIVQDSPANVYATNGLYPATVSTVPVTPRALVTRKLVDERYLPGVTTAVRAAYAEWNKSHSAPPGYNKYYGCPTSGDMTAMAGLASTDAVYIDCPGNAGITLNGTIAAGTIFFHGYIKGGVLSMPNATTVYVDDTDNSGARVNNDAIVLNNNNAFCIRAGACDTASPSTGQCSTAPTGNPLAKAQLIVRRGMLNGAGSSSLLRLCSTTVIMEGGQLGAGTAANPGGCLPTVFGTAPNPTPCVGASTSAGTGQINTSGFADWTAPNAYEDLKAPPINDDPVAKQSLWDGGEDLALWDETYADNSGSTYQMAGGGAMHVAGVFMVPNANPFHVTGSGTQDLTKSQYIVTKFTVGGGAILHMGVDPYNAVPPPKLTPFTLVR